MKENKFTEEESLKLISQMIKQSKENIEHGKGNVLLYFGYFTVFLSVLIFGLLHFTHNAAWSALWFLMFVPYAWSKISHAKRKPEVLTYIDSAIKNTWSVVGSLFLLSVIVIWVLGYITGIHYFLLMLPLSLLYSGIGVSITGVILRSKLLTYTPLVAFALAIYMLFSLVVDKGSSSLWNLYFGFSFLLMMVIPGHVLNINKKTNA